MNKPHTEVQAVAGAYLEALAGAGIEFVFANAGTDFAPIIEAMVRAGDQGRRIPRFVIVPHENVAVAMAHGYYRVCGRPAAVMVHVTVGTANALCGIMNASRDHVPLLLAAGRTPHTEAGQVGSRDLWIHWGQDAFDQGGMVREYVKWDYELRAGQPVEVLVARALDIAMSEPRGPVYLTLPREVLAGGVEEAPAPVPARAAGAVPAEPSPAMIERVAGELLDAEFPLILTSFAGRNPESFHLLAGIAQEFGIAVGQSSARDINLPSSHPMNFGAYPGAAIGQADLIVLIDCEVPWHTAAGAPRADTRLVHIAADPLFSRYPMRGFRVDLAIAGSSLVALRGLRAALRPAGGAKTAAIAARRERIARLAQSARERRAETVRRAAAMRPIHPAWLSACINKVKRRDTLVINELGVWMDFLELEEPGTYMTSSLAAGLGLGLGAALGARLAKPDLDVILIVGDGSYMLGNPTAAHFVARAERIPTLTVVANNRRWQAVHQATTGVYPEGRAVKLASMPLTALEPSPAFERTVEACDGYGERVEDPADLEAALARGLAAVAEGRPALVNVLTQAG